MGFAFVDAAWRLGCWLFSLNGKSQLSAGGKRGAVAKTFSSISELDKSKLSEQEASVYFMA